MAVGSDWLVLLFVVCVGEQGGAQVRSEGLAPKAATRSGDPANGVLGSL